MMMKIPSIILLAALSSYAGASDLSKFSIRGVFPGMASSEACHSLADDFPDKETLYKREGTRELALDPTWHFEVNGYIPKAPITTSNTKGCSSGYNGYDRKNASGAMTKSDAIEVDAKNGIVFKVENTQSLAVGSSINACQKRREGVIASLVSKYGEPTFMHDKGKKGKDYRHLIWDYSTDPSAGEGDEGFEAYQFYAECSMYEGSVNFAQMNIQTQFHSGQAIKQAASHAAVLKESYQPKL